MAAYIVHVLGLGGNDTYIQAPSQGDEYTRNQPLKNSAKNVPSSFPERKGIQSNKENSILVVVRNLNFPNTNMRNLGRDMSAIL